MLVWTGSALGRERRRRRCFWRAVGEWIWGCIVVVGGADWGVWFREGDLLLGRRGRGVALIVVFLGVEEVVGFLRDERRTAERAAARRRVVTGIVVVF